ncbi:hypothetical protein Ssi03_77040 [Sphaerisporangium siamense]|uniref:Site-specific recombinase XerD n=1 Tax=Sphaerisporangium siamense TaxID=795645 RepID=A0A7W7G8Z0_9ACTN|nr:site-specific integrase [Sphaerisporangium siamense]MBB4702278.1 site-specific recombinase XerD [Sphaerisporangium siamense]GII89714.1 hypothetical protein Ssi03_77040 [Sphaerisporangium siamense]
MTALAPRRTGPADPATLPAHTAVDHWLSPAARAAIEAGVPESTRRAYARDWSAFAAWCAERGRAPMPATAQTVTEYVTHLTAVPSARTGRPLAPPSIERALAAIRTMHQAADAGPPQTKAARKVLAGYRERLALAKDPAARPRKADPAVPDALRAMLATLDRATLAGKCDAVALLLGYACAARVSELAALDIADVAETSDGLLVTVYRRKIKKFTEAAIPYGRVPATCPVRAVRDLLAAMDRPAAPPGRCWCASTGTAASLRPCAGKAAPSATRPGG